ncbi:hypothetical protein [Mycobacterium kyorinense]|uniref:hypothetical protein n=1 Tax=Mycobacterium kyorinense TaxID=487514 RepID=UPI001E538B9F|nr:hypothetical protein [Mycobacterium kyorinense]
MIALAAAFLVVGRKVDGRPQAAVVPGLPQQLFLASSMAKQPVPGWKTNSDQLGLPPGSIAKPLRNVGDRGYFLGIADDGWWLVGIDVASGRRLFAPVQLGSAENASGIDCFTNGPSMVLCIRDDWDPGLPASVWVVNTNSGAVIFDGTTDLRIPPTENHPQLH